jgi:putative ABC transport system permease protein
LREWLRLPSAKTRSEETFDVSAIVQDIRYAARTLRRSPGFALVAIATLALGIGGTTAIFSVVDGVALRQLPYPEPDRLVSVHRTTSGGDEGSFAPADFLDLKRDSRVFAYLAGHRQDIVDLTGSGDPERLDAVQATGAFFQVFGAPALLGRTFTEASDPPEGPRVAVISEGIWRRRFGARADIVGQSMRLNGEAVTILGVMPAWFAHPRPVDVWILSPRPVPTSVVGVEGDLLTQRDIQYFGVVGRLAPGVTFTQATADVRAIGDRIAKEFPDSNAGETMFPVAFQDDLVGEMRTPMLVLLGAVAVVLLIACANVASLLLARGAGRRRELAVRTALGAGQWRIVTQLLTESLVLAAAGGILGIVLATWLVDVLLTLAPENTPRLSDVRFDPRVALFAVACTALVGLIFGVVPAVSASSPSVGTDLKDGGRSATTSRTRARNLLVVAEVAMALVLLIGAGLLLSSFQRLRSVDPGFRTTNLAAVQVPLPMTRYDEAGQRRFYTSLRERLAGNTLTAESAIVFPFPLRNSTATSGYRVVGREYPDGTEPNAELGAVSPGYFATAGIPFIKGRDFTDADAKAGQQVVVINRTLAEREWPGRDPVGEHIIAGGPIEDESNWLRVIGVVADSKRRSLQAAPQAAVYLSYQQFTLPFMGVLVRSDAGLAAITSAVASAVHEIDKDLPLGDSYTIEQLISSSTGEPRFRALLVAAFATVALTLALVGIYGLISYTVSQRIPEIGVRLALGATPAQVRQLVLGDGLKLAAIGVALGVIGALAVAQTLQSLLFSISATEPAIYVGVSMLLLAVAALACWMPARRAMRVDPVVALRSE